jgi:hypothetical protein
MLSRPGKSRMTAKGRNSAKDRASGPPVTQFKGWTALSGVRAYCRKCGVFRDFHEVVYWKKEGERTIVSCEECLNEQA